MPSVSADQGTERCSCQLMGMGSSVPRAAVASACRPSRIAAFALAREPLVDATLVALPANPKPILRSLEIGACPSVQRMQHRPRAAEKETPSASSKTEEQVNLRASFCSGDAPGHELLAVVESRVIEILPDACPCPRNGFFHRVLTRHVLPDRVGMASQEIFQCRYFDRSALQSVRQPGIKGRPVRPRRKCRGA